MQLLYLPATLVPTYSSYTYNFISEFRRIRSFALSLEFGIFNGWDTWHRVHCFPPWGTSTTSSVFFPSAITTRTPWTSSRRWIRMETASKNLYNISHWWLNSQSYIGLLQSYFILKPVRQPGLKLVPVNICSSHSTYLHDEPLTTEQPIYTGVHQSYFALKPWLKPSHCEHFPTSNSHWTCHIRLQGCL